MDKKEEEVEEKHDDEAVKEDARLDDTLVADPSEYHDNTKELSPPIYDAQGNLIRTDLDIKSVDSTVSAMDPSIKETIETSGGFTDSDNGMGDPEGKSGKKKNKKERKKTTNLGPRIKVLKIGPVEACPDSEEGEDAKA